MGDAERKIKGTRPVKGSDRAAREVAAVIDAAADYPPRGPSIGAVVNGIRKGRRA